MQKYQNRPLGVKIVMLKREHAFSIKKIDIKISMLNVEWLSKWYLSM